MNITGVHWRYRAVYWCTYVVAFMAPPHVVNSPLNIQRHFELELPKMSPFRWEREPQTFKSSDEHLKKTVNVLHRLVEHVVKRVCYGLGNT